MLEQVRKPAPVAVLVAVAPLVGCHAALLALFDLCGHPGLWLGLEAGAFAALAFAQRRLSGVRWGVGTLLLVGALLRGLLLPLPLTLSDDAYRYLWDGRVALAGFDPYATAPDSATLEPLRDELWQRVAHRDVPTVYPPAAIGLFSIAAALPGSIYVLKASLALCDLAAGALLLWLAVRAGLPRERVLWYAWNPLVVLEGAGMAHVDVAGAAFAIAAVAFLVARSDRRVGAQSVVAGLAAAVSILLKLVPICAMPVWIRHARHRGAFAIAAVFAALVGLLPMIARPSVVPPGLVRYGVSWEFNGPLFEPMWRGLDAVDAAPRVKGVLDRLKGAAIRRGGEAARWNALYPYVYPQLLAKAVLAVILVGALVFAAAARDPLVGTLRAFAAALVLHATVYPWYAVWVLPWAALRAAWPWQVLSFSILFSYLPRALGIATYPAAYLLVWAPFVSAAAVWALRRRSGADSAGGAIP